MKVIFDSEEEKEYLVNARCPGGISKDLHDSGYDDHCYDTCLECWEKCGIELEVKKDE